MRLYPRGNASEKRLMVSPQFFDPRDGWRPVKNMTTDSRGRYSYRAQPQIGHWKLYALGHALARIGAPAILKTRRLGYDGRGQIRLRSADDARGFAPGLDVRTLDENELTAALDELRAGEIRHALVLAYPGLRQRWFVSPGAGSFARRTICPICSSGSRRKSASCRRQRSKRWRSLPITSQ